MKFLGPRFVIAMTIVVCCTLLYVAGLLVTSQITPVEPQSVFTLYGAILGYLFGSHEKQQASEEAKKGKEDTAI